jgi:hypothetical protein
MKKSYSKLRVRRETLQILSSLELTRAAGADTALVADTGDKMCPAPHIKPK